MNKADKQKMVHKVDLIMWTYNGASTLPAVLERISRVIPNYIINKKIIADDNSKDNTRQIAESYGWTVIRNEGSGISDNANTALKQVSTDFFISFEQDLMLAWDWWKKIPPLILQPKVAVASGMRFANRPKGIRCLQQYVARKYRGEAELASWLKGREMAAFTLGKTLDNTLYKTKVIKGMGGFPKLNSGSGVDTTLAYLVNELGYEWRVAYDVQSVHLRKGLRQELDHQFWYARQLNEMWNQIENSTKASRPPVTKFDVFYRFVLSPFTGVFLAFKTKEPSLAYIHTLIRLFYLRGLLTSYLH